MESVGPVIGGDIEVLPADRAHLILEYHQILILCALHDIRRDPLLLQPFDLRIDRRCADAAGHKENVHFPEFLRRLFGELRGTSERSHDILKEIALVQLRHPVATRADNLEDDQHGALLAVIVADGQRNALAVAIDFYNQELSRQTLRGDARCLDIHEPNLLCKFLFLQDFIHKDSPLL